MSMKFWRQWLYVVIGGVILYSLGLIILPQVMHTFFNMLFFASSESLRRFGETTPDFIALIYGVLGAVIIGWMVSLMSILIGHFQNNPRETWNTVTLSLVIWYTLDTGFSLVIGAVGHALFNTLFLVMFAIPLGATYSNTRNTESNYEG